MLRPASLLGPLTALTLIGASFVASASAPAWSGAEALVPADAPVILLSRSPAELLDRVAFDTIAGKHAWLFKEAREAVAQEFGADLLTEAGWKSWGLDLRRPAALACIDLEHEVWVLWIAVADAGVFEGLVTRNPVAQPIRETVGDATVYLERHGMRIVARGGYVGIVLESHDDGHDAATSLAGLTADHALAGSPRFAALVASAGASDAAAAIDINALVMQDFRHQEARNDEPSWSERELDDAKKSNADPARIADLEKAAESERTYSKQRRDALKQERDTVAAMIAPLKGIAVGLTAEGQSFMIEGDVLLADGDPYRPILKNDASLALTHALARPPAFLVEARAEPRATLDLLKKLYVAAGGPGGVDGLATAVRDGFAVDLDSDWTKTLAGDVGFALSIGGDKKGSPPEWAFVASLADSAVGKALLGRVAESNQGKGMLTADGSGYRTSGLGESDGTFAVAGSWLVGATDKALAGRITAGTAGGFAGKSPNKALAALVSQNGVAGFFLMDAGAVILGTMRSVGEAPQVDVQPDGTSPKVVALYKKLSALQKKRMDVEVKRDGERVAHTRKIATFVGSTAFTVAVAPRGFHIRGGQYFGGASLSATLDGLIGLAQSIRVTDKKYDDAIQTINTQIDEVLQSIDDQSSR